MGWRGQGGTGARDGPGLGRADTATAAFFAELGCPDMKVSGRPGRGGGGAGGRASQPASQREVDHHGATAAAAAAGSTSKEAGAGGRRGRREKRRPARRPADPPSLCIVMGPVSVTPSDHQGLA